MESSLKDGCGVFEDKGRPCVPVRAEVCSERCLVLVPLRNHYLPAVRAAFKRRKYSNVSRRVSAVVDAEKPVGI